MKRSLPFLFVAVLCASFAAAQVAPVPAQLDPEEQAKAGKVEKPALKQDEKVASKTDAPAPVVDKAALEKAAAMQPAPAPKPLPPGAPAPKIGCTKPQFDFGEAGQNEEVIHDFEIENTGKADLDIISAHGSCGCTAVAPPDKKTLKPGEKTNINVNLKTLTNQGPISKTVTVTTNDPVTPNFVMTISGKVTQPFRPSVSELNFGTLVKGNPVPPKSFEVLTNTAQSITEIKSDSDQVTATFEALPVEEKKQGYKITVNVTGTLPVGLLRANLSIGTTVPSQKMISVPVLATVDGEVQVKPRTFNFGKVKKGDATTKVVEIEKSGKADLKIESVQIKPEGAFTVKLEEVTPGKTFKIVLGISPDAKDGYSRGTVSIKTNCPGETDLQAYFYALLEK